MLTHALQFDPVDCLENVSLYLDNQDGNAHVPETMYLLYSPHHFFLPRQDQLQSICFAINGKLLLRNHHNVLAFYKHKSSKLTWSFNEILGSKIALLGTNHGVWGYYISKKLIGNVVQ